MEIAEQALVGITRNEISQLRKTYYEDKFYFFNKLRLRYIVPLGLVGLEYYIFDEVEATLFTFIQELIFKISTTGYPDAEILLTISHTIIYKLRLTRNWE